MIEISQRRLRIRNDGYGAQREQVVKLSDFDNEDAIVILGDPGIGKTTLLRTESGGTMSSVREFMAHPTRNGTPALFLDGLDEYRILAKGEEVTTRLASALCELGKPRFRISCRAADWYGSSDLEVLRVASASGRITVLEILPLNNEEISTAVADLVPNADTFIMEATAANLASLLSNPHTLELIAGAWSGARKPRNKFEAFDLGVAKMILEARVLGPDRSQPHSLRQAAGAIASTILLSNSIGLTRNEGTVNEQYFHQSLVPVDNIEEVDDVLKRRLFTSPASHQFEFIHRTIAEFLAAEDLARRIESGLPITRVLALLGGIDGKPSASLRGLFAWLMCRLTSRADAYVGLDPYAVSTYGDTSVLTPVAQKAVLRGLQELVDPWFLSNEEDRGSFRGLANADTAPFVAKILDDEAASAHLKVAMLEAIANSVPISSFANQLRRIAIGRSDNIWMRSAAAKAYVKAVSGDADSIKSLDTELREQTADDGASVVRVALLEAGRCQAGMADQILSILKQASTISEEDYVSGYFYPLLKIADEEALDELLDGVGEILPQDVDTNFELRSLFEEWFKARLSNAHAIDAVRLAKWVPTILPRHRYSPEELRMPLVNRFVKEPHLFEQTFDILSVPKDGSLDRHIAYDLWDILPPYLWPYPAGEFLLKRAMADAHVGRSAELFSWYLSALPRAGLLSHVAESGFSFLEARPEVAKVLGEWNVCSIPEWRREQAARNEGRSGKLQENRTKNIEYFTPHLSGIREGRIENILIWAVPIYLGRYSDSEMDRTAKDRLSLRSNEEIANAIIEGFTHYVEREATLPTAEEIVAGWSANKLQYKHILVALSVFLRASSKKSVPEFALGASIAAVATSMQFEKALPDFENVTFNWLCDQIAECPCIAEPIVESIWIAGARGNSQRLRRFDEFAGVARVAQSLTAMIKNVLPSVGEDENSVATLAAHLLVRGQNVIREVGPDCISGTSSATVRAIWSAALFCIDPETYIPLWRTLSDASDEVLKSACALLSGDQLSGLSSPDLVAAQRREVALVLGARFPSIPTPRSDYGERSSWDVSLFVARQIEKLAADPTPEAGKALDELVCTPALSSYRDLIQHRLAQRVTRLRQSAFTFADAHEIAAAIRNDAPATAADLLAYVVDHLQNWGRELRATQTDKYHVFWNQNGNKSLISPKHEEECSAVLADALQARVKSHGLKVVVEHHMVSDKECDIVVLQGIDRLLPIEVKHHYNENLWTGWDSQLDKFYASDAAAGGLGIYLVLWSGERGGRSFKGLPDDIQRPSNAHQLAHALENRIPDKDRARLRVIVVDIAPL